MTAIKILLLAGILAFGFVAYRGVRSAGHRVVWRLGGMLVLLGAAAGVLFPDSLTVIAHKVGVGRGADLVLYVLAVTFMLVTVGIFRRLNELETRFVALTRRLAIAEALAEHAEPARGHGVPTAPPPTTAPGTAEGESR